jgi:hypothetical protein
LPLSSSSSKASGWKRSWRRSARSIEMTAASSRKQLEWNSRVSASDRMAYRMPHAACRMPRAAGVGEERKGGSVCVRVWFVTVRQRVCTCFNEHVGVGSGGESG